MPITKEQLDDVILIRLLIPNALCFKIKEREYELESIPGEEEWILDKQLTSNENFNKISRTLHREKLGQLQMKNSNNGGYAEIGPDAFKQIPLKLACKAQDTADQSSMYNLLLIYFYTFIQDIHISFLLT